MNTQRSPDSAASRLSSFQSQTRTGTVAGRFTGFTPQKADSVSPFPARIALQGEETRGRRCDVSLPSARRRPVTGPARPTTLPGLRTNYPNSPGELAGTRLDDTRQTRSCEPFYNNKILGVGQRIRLWKGWFGGVFEENSWPRRDGKRILGLAKISQFPVCRQTIRDPDKRCSLLGGLHPPRYHC